MIANAQEYQRAREDLAHLEAWLARLCEDYPGGEKELTKAGVRKMITHLGDELSRYGEGSALDEDHPE